MKFDGANISFGCSRNNQDWLLSIGSDIIRSYIGAGGEAAACHLALNWISGCKQTAVRLDEESKQRQPLINIYINRSCH